MTVEEAIKYLSQMPSETPLIMSWWEQDMIAPHLSKEQWAAVSSIAEHKMDWSQIHEQLTDLVCELAHASGAPDEDEEI